MTCERCKKVIPLQHGFDTNSIVLKPRTNSEIIITPLCDECATDIFFTIDHWLGNLLACAELLKDREEEDGDMTVKELIEKLQKLPPEKTILFCDYDDYYRAEVCWDITQEYEMGYTDDPYVYLTKIVE